MSLDSKINHLVNKFNAGLWQGYNNYFIGRTYRVHNNENMLRPHEYLNGREYIEVLYSDKYDSVIFFDVEPTEVLQSVGYAKADVNIIVSLNLGTIYGNNTRAVEQAHNDVLSMLAFSDFKVYGLKKGLTALDDYDIPISEQKIYNMQPLYVFKIESEIQYNINAVTCV